MADITTDILDYATNGSKASGFLARPQGGGPFPAVVVIQEWWGLKTTLRTSRGDLPAKASSHSRLTSTTAK